MTNNVNTESPHGQCLTIQGVVVLFDSSFYQYALCISVELVGERESNERESNDGEPTALPVLRARWGKSYGVEKDNCCTATKQTELEYGLCAIANVLGNVDMFKVIWISIFFLFVRMPPSQGKKIAKGTDINATMMQAAAENGFEIVIIDDNCNDEFKELCSEKSLPGFIFVQENGRCGAVRRVWHVHGHVH